ncbi:hypothetical protein [Azospirillum baldaniorum]|uniref:hypothetical protein n=1 Tax=Azospirillum baldaniorum TaxID=1064539 RepID=UPI0002E7086F|nr:hypothetical protein [Azospirillum baldaniorum]
MEGLLIPAFGYTSHISIDRQFRLIRCFTVTGAARRGAARRGMTAHSCRVCSTPTPDLA